MNKKIISTLTITVFLVIIISALFYFKHKNENKGETLMYIKNNLNYVVKDKAALKNLLCEKDSPLFPAEKEMYWYINCNTNVRAVNSYYTALGWKSKELSGPTMQFFFSDLLFKIAKAKGDKKIKCEVDANNKQKSDCVVSFVSGTTRVFNFSVFYFPNEEDVDVDNFVLVCDFDPAGKKETIDRKLNALIKDVTDDGLLTKAKNYFNI